MADDFGNGDDMVLPVGKEEVDCLIRENKHIFSDTQCKVCSAVLISESQKLAHYQSKKHANKVRRYNSIQQGDECNPTKKMKTDTESNGEEDKNKFCSICNMTFSSPVVAQSHYNGKTHSKNLKMKEQGGVQEVAVFKKATAKTEDKVDQNDPDKYCKICNATFNNPQMAQQHYSGKKHKKHETKNELMTVYSSTGKTPPSQPFTPSAKKKNAAAATPVKGYSCDTCNIVLNSIEQYQAHISGAKHKNQLMSMVPTCSSAAAAPPPSIGGHSTSGAGGLLPLGSAIPAGGGYSSSRDLSPIGGHSTSGAGGLLPLGSSLGGGYSSRDVSPLSKGGLLPPPSYPPLGQSQQSSYYREDRMGSDGYNYFSRDY
ncbi:zinc finger protein 346 [Discoglossus pictus]